VKPTPNLRTLEKAAEALQAAGRKGVEINALGTTSAEILPMLAAAGATHIEPGHGLTGTTPLHAVEDLPETPVVEDLYDAFGRQADWPL
jgi:predicted amino acid racemase